MSSRGKALKNIKTTKKEKDASDSSLKSQDATKTSTDNVKRRKRKAARTSAAYLLKLAKKKIEDRKKRLTLKALSSASSQSQSINHSMHEEDNESPHLEYQNDKEENNSQGDENLVAEEEDVITTAVEANPSERHVVLSESIKVSSPPIDVGISTQKLELPNNDQEKIEIQPALPSLCEANEKVNTESLLVRCDTIPNNTLMIMEIDNCNNLSTLHNNDIILPTTHEDVKENEICNSPTQLLSTTDHENVTSNNVTVPPEVVNHNDLIEYFDNNNSSSSSTSISSDNRYSQLISQRSKDIPTWLVGLTEFSQSSSGDGDDDKKYALHLRNQKPIEQPKTPPGIAPVSLVLKKPRGRPKGTSTSLKTKNIQDQTNNVTSKPNYISSSPSSSPTRPLPHSKSKATKHNVSSAPLPSLSESSNSYSETSKTVNRDINRLTSGSTISFSALQVLDENNSQQSPEARRSKKRLFGDITSPDNSNNTSLPLSTTSKRPCLAEIDTVYHHYQEIETHLPSDSSSSHHQPLSNQSNFELGMIQHNNSTQQISYEVLYNHNTSHNESLHSSMQPINSEQSVHYDSTKLEQHMDVDDNMYSESLPLSTTVHPHHDDPHSLTSGMLEEEEQDYFTQSYEHNMSSSKKDNFLSKSAPCSFSYHRENNDDSSLMDMNYESFPVPTIENEQNEFSNNTDQQTENYNNQFSHDIYSVDHSQQQQQQHNANINSDFSIRDDTHQQHIPHNDDNDNGKVNENINNAIPLGRHSVSLAYSYTGSIFVIGTEASFIDDHTNINQNFNSTSNTTSDNTYPFKSSATIIPDKSGFLYYSTEIRAPQIIDGSIKSVSYSCKYPYIPDGLTSILTGSAIEKNSFIK